MIEDDFIRPQYLISYDDEGKILNCQGADLDSLIDEQNKSEFNTIISETSASNADSYVDVSLKEIKPKGIQPDYSYNFDYLSGTWIFDIALGKEGKWIQIKEQRNAQEFGSFEWQGTQVQCDEISQRRLQGAVQLAAINPSIVIDWTLEDNSVVTLTAEQVISMGSALGGHVTDTHEHGRMLRQLINNATTEAQLDLINW